MPLQLEYFDINGRALLARILLDYCKVEYIDKRLTPQEFGANKAAGRYRFGQVPVMFFEDGEHLTQSMAIARHIAENNRGRNGERLYDKRDHETCYQIDLIFKDIADLAPNWINFTIPIVPAYKDKDDHFVSFICKTFPAHLAKLEARFSQHSGKYILGKELTLGDFVAAIPFFLLSHNEGYENSHIVSAVV